jgi:hypothetical protein
MESGNGILASGVSVFLEDLQMQMGGRTVIWVEVYSRIGLKYTAQNKHLTSHPKSALLDNCAHPKDIIPRSFRIAGIHRSQLRQTIYVLRGLAVRH